MDDDYDARDSSILLPILKRHVFLRLLPLIPEGMSANTLTLLGTVLSSVGLAVAVLVPTTRWSITLVALLVLAYVTLDNIDGAHARRTGTGSPLGEFLDHWLDSLNNVFLYMGAIFILDLNATQAVVVLAFGTISYSLVFWEQRATGRIKMSWYGNLEGILSIAAIYLAVVVMGLERAFTPLVSLGGWDLAYTDLVFVLALFVTSGNILGVLVRARHHLVESLLVFIPVGAVVMWYLGGAVPWMAACVLLMLMSPAIAGRMLISRVVGQRDLNPDRLLVWGSLVLSIICVLAPISPQVQTALMGLLLGYAILGVSRDFIKTVRRLEQYLRPGELLALPLRLRRH